MRKREIELEAKQQFTVKLMGRQTKLGLAAHKIELENAKIENCLPDTARGRDSARNAKNS